MVRNAVLSGERPMPKIISLIRVQAKTEMKVVRAPTGRQRTRWAAEEELIVMAGAAVEIGA